jgi:hypothetical protein
MTPDLELLTVGRISIDLYCDQLGADWHAARTFTNTVSAPPGYELYYLNVMAGPTRLWAVANDPDHEWTLTPADVAPTGTTRSTR